MREDICTMPSMKWTQLNHIQLGRYGEYYAKMEFTSYGYDVYTSEVDNHGVDFVVKNPNNNHFYEVQVKSICKCNYAFIKKDKILLDDYHLVCLLHFIDGELPDMYIIPATVWKSPCRLFADRKYNKQGQKTKPEYGINYSKRNLNLLNKYTAEKYFIENCKT